MRTQHCRAFAPVRILRTWKAEHAVEDSHARPSRRRRPGHAGWVDSWVTFLARADSADRAARADSADRAARSDSIGRAGRAGGLVWAAARQSARGLAAV
jgi:hypothetical protein